MSRRLTFAVKLEVDKQLMVNARQQAVAVRLADFIGPDNELAEYRVASVSVRATSVNIPLPLLVDVSFNERGVTRRGDRLHAAIGRIEADTRRAELVQSETEQSGVLIVQPNSTAEAPVDDFTAGDAAAFEKIDCPGWTFAKLRRECEYGSEVNIVAEDHPVNRVLCMLGKQNDGGWLNARAEVLDDGRVAVRRECFQHMVDEIHSRLERWTAENVRVSLHASFKPLVPQGVPWNFNSNMNEVPIYLYPCTGKSMKLADNDSAYIMATRVRGYVTLEFILLLEAPPGHIADRPRA